MQFVAGEKDNVIIKVRNLIKKYGRNTVINNISFDIRKGEIFGFLGPNGAGKSTLVSILATLIKPTSGDIIVNGFSVSREADRIRDDIGYVPQEIALYPMLSGWDNMDFWAGIYGLRGNLKRERIAEAAALAGLQERLKDPVSEYSGGMKRRLNFAVSLMHHPQILLLDEPTVGVDIHTRRCILDALADLKSKGRTIIYVSHYTDELEKLCDRIAIMDNGRILAIGAACDLKREFGAAGLEEILFRLTENHNV